MLPAQSEQSAECPVSLDDHINLVLLAVLQSGLGACEKTYQALVEIGEFVRVYKGYDLYTPQQTDILLKQKEDGEKRLAAARLASLTPEGRA